MSAEILVYKVYSVLNNTDRTETTRLRPGDSGALLYEDISGPRPVGERVGLTGFREWIRLTGAKLIHPKTEG